MIRNIVLVRFKEGTDRQRIDAIATAMARLRLKGMRSWNLVSDLGLRDGNMTHAMISEFDDEDAYRTYDADPEHNRVRRELLAPIVDRLERFQYRV
jgi:stress responsive alpha/beta barrel protein